MLLRTDAPWSREQLSMAKAVIRFYLPDVIIALSCSYRFGFAAASSSKGEQSQGL